VIEAVAVRDFLRHDLAVRRAVFGSTPLNVNTTESR